MHINEQLLIAAANGDTTKVRELLEAGADIHAYDDLALQLATIEEADDTISLLRERMAAQASVPQPPPCLYMDPESGALSFAKRKGFTPCRPTDPKPAVADEGTGFDAFVFDNRDAYEGFKAGLAVMRMEHTNELSIAWDATTEGRYLVAYRHEGMAFRKWFDMRGDEILRDDFVSYKGDAPAAARKPAAPLPSPKPAAPGKGKGR